MAEFDYLVIGGGTAGCIVAARLAQDPAVTVGLVEWGPSDEHEPRARSIRRWAEMLEGEYDLDYRSVPQERGNSGIRQARLRILGGCSTANTMISWRPRVADLQEWVDLGARGWDAATVHPYYERLRAPITPVPPQDQNPFVAGVIASASTALGLPVRSAWNDRDVIEGTGFFEIGYRPETNTRSSSSICYLHPAQLGHGFKTAALIAAAFCAAGGVLAALTIRNPSRTQCAENTPQGFSCALEAPPLRQPALGQPELRTLEPTTSTEGKE